MERFLLCFCFHVLELLYHQPSKLCSPYIGGRIKLIVFLCLCIHGFLSQSLVLLKALIPCLGWNASNGITETNTTSFWKSRSTRNELWGLSDDVTCPQCSCGVWCSSFRLPSERLVWVFLMFCLPFEDVGYLFNSPIPKEGWQKRLYWSAHKFMYNKRMQTVFEMWCCLIAGHLN